MFCWLHRYSFLFFVVVVGCFCFVVWLDAERLSCGLFLVWCVFWSYMFWRLVVVGVDGFVCFVEWVDGEEEIFL